MSKSNASIAMAVDPFLDISRKYTRNTPRRGAGAGKGPLDPEAEIKRFKQALTEDNLAPRGYKIMLAKAIDVMEILQERIVNPPLNPKTGHANENSSMAKIIQEIQAIKVTLSQTHGLVRQQGQSWAKVASMPEVAGSTIRIQDEEEKRTVAKLSSEELVKKIGRPEIVGVRQMKNGNVKVFYAGKETKELMETQKDWTLKIAATAQLATPMFQVLVHDMPLTFEPGNQDQISELQQAN